MTLERYLELSHIDVLPAPNSRPGLRIERALGARAGQRRVSLRVPYFSVAARALAAGDQVLTMTRFFASELQRLAPLKIVAAPLEVPPLRFSMVWHRDRDGDRRHQRFRELVALECLDRVEERAKTTGRRARS